MNAQDGHKQNKQRKKLNVNCTKMLLPVLNKCWKKHSKRQQLCDHQSPISETIQQDMLGIAGEVRMNL